MRVVALFLLLAGVMTACSLPAPSSAPEEEEETVHASAPVVTLRGPIALLETPDRLRAQKSLAELPNVVRLRLDDHGAMRSLALAGDVLSASTPQARAFEALARYSEALGFEGMDEAGIASRVRVERVRDDGSATHVRLRQVASGIAMDDRSLDVHVSNETPARLLGINGSAALPQQIEAADALVPEADVLALVQKDASATITSSLRYLDVQGRSVLAYRLELRSPGVSDTLYYSAKDARFLRKDEGLQHGSAQAYTFPESSREDQRAWMPLANLSISPEFGGQDLVSDASGRFPFDGNVRFSLQGPYVRVRNRAGASFSYHGPSEAFAGSVTEENPHEPELAVFLHVNSIHDALQTRFGYAGMNRALPVYVGEDVCNAFADMDKWELHFGVCGQKGSVRYSDFALSRDVVIHEYMHLVAQDIVKLRFGCSDESGAYGEGLSDYFACSFTDDYRIGEDTYGEIFRSCYTWLDYKHDYASGECHDGAFLTSSPLWSVRIERGAEVADDLAFWSMYYMPERPSILDVREAILAADRARHGGANADVIMRGFAVNGVDDKPFLFVTTNKASALSRPFSATVVAHAQGFDRKTVKYAWAFDDDKTAEGDVVVHTFRKKKGWAKVRVHDASGLSRDGELGFSSACGQAQSPVWLVLALAMLLRRIR